MSYPQSHASPPIDAAPPAPPPKPSQQLSSPPPLPSHPSQHYYQNPSSPNRPIPQGVFRPEHQPGSPAPVPNTAFRPTSGGHWTSTWDAPYPPDQNSRQYRPDPPSFPQRRDTYPRSYDNQQSQRRERTAERQVHEADSEHQHHSQQQQNHFERPRVSRSHSQYPQEQYHLPTNIQSKTITDLSALLSDPQLLSALINSPEMQPVSLQNSVAQLNAQLAANTELAQSLSSLHETLLNARATTSSNLLRLRGLETTWKKKQKELELRLEPWGPRELHQRLGATIAEGDGVCGALEASFIDAATSGGEGIADEREVTEWIRRVREGRKTIALRRERKRRWDEGRVGGWR